MRHLVAFALLSLAATDAFAAPDFLLSTNANGAGFAIGGTAAFDVVNAAPGRTVYLFISENGAGQGACAIDGTCLDVIAWSPIAHARANNTGGRSWSFPTPDYLEGQIICAQAAVLVDGIAHKSNVVCEAVGPILGESVTSGLNTYFVTPYNETWMTAEIMCANAGMHIAMPDDMIEDLVINDLWQGYGLNSVWLGIDDLDIEGSFVGIDGLPLSFVNWGGGEPNNMGEEDCAQMGGGGEWNDLNCQAELGVICEL